MIRITATYEQSSTERNTINKRYALKVKRFYVCDERGWGMGTSDQRYFIDAGCYMSVYKFSVGPISTRFYRSGDQRSFAFALTKSSSFKFYHIQLLYIIHCIIITVLSTLFCCLQHHIEHPPSPFLAKCNYNSSWLE